MKTGTELRREALREVEDCVCRDRQNSYGSAEDNFAVIAEFWTTHLRTRGLIAPGVKIESFDVAAMSGLIKSARAAHNPHHRDSWVDLAGYAVCGAGIIARAAEEATAAASAVIGDESLPPCGLSSAEKLGILADAASPIAAGHNPDKLTEVQVCVEEGWRLLAPPEIRVRDATEDIQAWVADERWAPFFSGDQRWITYRTKKPPGYFLPPGSTFPDTHPQYQSLPSGAEQLVYRSYAEALNAEVAR